MLRNVLWGTALTVLSLGAQVLPDQPRDTGVPGAWTVSGGPCPRGSGVASCPPGGYVTNAPVYVPVDDWGVYPEGTLRWAVAPYRDALRRWIEQPGRHSRWIAPAVRLNRTIDCPELGPVTPVYDCDMHFGEGAEWSFSTSWNVPRHVDVSRYVLQWRGNYDGQLVEVRLNGRRAWAANTYTRCERCDYSDVPDSYSREEGLPSSIRQGFLNGPNEITLVVLNGMRECAMRAHWTFAGEDKWRLYQDETEYGTTGTTWPSIPLRGR